MRKRLREKSSGTPDGLLAELGPSLLVKLLHVLLTHWVLTRDGRDAVKIEDEAVYARTQLP